MTTAVVFDYGFGNVRSMVRALANLGVDTTLTSDYRQSLEADGLVVPGVGAFAACMEGLKKVDGDRVIYDRIRAGRPVLGVCVGEQIMFEHGLEHGAACRRHRTDRRFGEPAGRRRGASHGMGHDRGRPRFGAAQRRGERTVLLRALLRRDGSEAGGYVPLRHRSERFARTRELVLVRPIALCGRLRTRPAVRHAIPPGKVRGRWAPSSCKNWIATL